MVGTTRSVTRAATWRFGCSRCWLRSRCCCFLSRSRSRPRARLPPGLLQDLGRPVLSSSRSDHCLYRADLREGLRRHVYRYRRWRRRLPTGSAQVNADGIARRSLSFTVAGANTVSVSGTSDKGEALKLSTNVAVTGASDGTGNDGTGGNNGGSDNSSGDNGSNDNPRRRLKQSSGVPFFGGGLPRTGSDIAVTALIGLALIGGGAALVTLGRNRT